MTASWRERERERELRLTSRAESEREATVDGMMTAKAAACFESVDERRSGVPGSVVVFVGDEQQQQKRREGGEEEGEGCSTTAAKKNKKKSRVVECRICQEEDEVYAMESPCACSGTLKNANQPEPSAQQRVNELKAQQQATNFAHRKCIQRWCNKKGDINCEICSQVFSPNYSLPPATINPDLLAIDVRQAWVPNINLRDSHLIALAAAERQLLQSEYDDYAVESSGSIACLRSVALILLIILLLRQALLVTREAGLVQGSSKLFNVSVLQFAGFLLPCYVMARTWYLQSRRRQV
ncbi:uncharacterized protein LOC116203572 [Punica granatum]|uniref:Uncharacterized protein LOC116203572 n=1 Tax=Punica granatum TaxID=22663 RepID=A0A6P8D442_PUNGR|nr:uncharacterized protein LOC116203572 [Punica granatum]